jgi:phosphoribosylamine--glycine ligase
MKKMMDTRVLVVDGTGRGHAICDLFTRTDPDVTVFYGPGCDVIEHDRIIPVPSISLEDPGTCLAFLKDNPVEFVFVSSIDALSQGYVDVLRTQGIRAIGPTKRAAELESSKARGKRFCLDHGIPVASSGSFTDPEDAKRYIRSLPHACVVKADGLCPVGDGSHVCSTAAEAEAAVDFILGQTGAAFRVVVEERLYGPELSVFALLDGDSYLLFPAAVDYKRALDGDLGKNCDGMGSIAPHPADSPALRAEIRRTLLDPLCRGLEQDGLDYTGFIYLGTMMTEGGLKVIEINARFGDSEAEAVLPGVQSNFTTLCRGILSRSLRHHQLVTDGLIRSAIAATQGSLSPQDPDSLPGWPFGDFAAGQRVTGFEAVDRSKATVFYASLRRDQAGLPVTTGGRVLHVVGTGLSLEEALENAYQQIARISFPGMRYRMDIGAELLGGWAGRERVDRRAITVDARRMSR